MGNYNEEGGSGGEEGVGDRDACSSEVVDEENSDCRLLSGGDI